MQEGKRGGRQSGMTDSVDLTENMKEHEGGLHVEGAEAKGNGKRGSENYEHKQIAPLAQAVRHTVKLPDGPSTAMAMEAAQMSGARWLATQLRILIPLLTPALSSAFLVAFIIALREFTIPFILYSSENLVLPVLVWQLFQNGEPARSAALGVLMIAVILPGILALRLFLGRDR